MNITQNQKRHKKTKQHPMNVFLLFFGSLFIKLAFMLLPLIIGIKISQHFNLRLYTGLYFSLLFLGIYLSGQVSNKLFKQTNRKQLIRDWKDRIVACSSMIVFMMVLFLPELLKTGTTFAYFLSFISALTVAFLIWRFLGSKELRDQFRFKRAKPIDPESQRTARRQLVVLLGAVIAFCLPLQVAALLEIKVARMPIFRAYGPTLDGIEIPIAIIIVLSVMIGTLLVGVTILSIFWRIFLTFYLTVDELQELDRMPSPYVPLLKPVYTKVASKLLEWKIARENKKLVE
jgi:MFS family permease